MARILRGDVVWADLSPVVGHEQAGQRPVVVLSADVFNERSGTVIAMALTSRPQRAGFPLTLELKSLKSRKRAWVRSAKCGRCRRGGWAGSSAASVPRSSIGSSRG